MPGLLQHLWITLKLNFRSKQAIAYGYVVPIFFLVAFGGVFRSDKTLLREMGQLLTVTVLGGCCFGMPTAMVNERERGVWRRYRLLPTAIGGIILSAMVARFVIVASAAILQMLLARLCYSTPWPEHPAQLVVAFTFVMFAFLGLGLVIAMLADTVPAVQALGQAVFLPMIMIGGVGVPMGVLPDWAKHVAGFFPGRYAVEAFDACYRGEGLQLTTFGLLALTVIGLSACISGAKLFRWDVGQRLAPGAKPWLAVSLLAWAGVGYAAERRLRAANIATASTNPVNYSNTNVKNATNPSTLPVTAPTTTLAVAEVPTTGPRVPTSWREVTRADMEAVNYDDVPDDGGAVTPFAGSREGLDKDIAERLADLDTALLEWKPGQVADVGQRVRNVLCVCAIPDVAQDLLEAYVPLVVFDDLKSDIQKDELMKALTWITIKPTGGTVVTNIKDLGFDAEIPEESVRERSYLYAKKMLHRLMFPKPPE